MGSGVGSTQAPDGFVTEKAVGQGLGGGGVIQEVDGFIIEKLSGQGGASLGVRLELDAAPTIPTAERLTAAIRMNLVIGLVWNFISYLNFSLSYLCKTDVN
jgi:hypothetical protein